MSCSGENVDDLYERIWAAERVVEAAQHVEWDKLPVGTFLPGMGALRAAVAKWEGAP